MGLRARLAGLFAAAVAVLVLAGGLLLAHQLETGVDAALDSALTTRADALAQQVGPDGSVGDFQDGTAAGSLIPPGQALAQVIGPTGALVESSEGAGTALLLTPDQLERARRGAIAVTVTVAGGDSVRVHAQPADQPGLGSVVVLVGSRRDVVTAGLTQIRTAWWVGGPVVVLAAGLGAWLLAGAVLRPVERMRARAAEISAQDITARLPVPDRDDEIARLGRTLNALLERLDETVTRQRGFVADAGHELRTPLATLRAELELATRPGRSQDELQTAVHAALQDTDRLIRLAEDLLVLARSDTATLPLHPRLLDLTALTGEAARAAAALAAPATVTVEVRTDEAALVTADPVRIRQVLDNLLSNAMRAAPTGTSITLTVHPCVDTDRVHVTVADRGPGFPPQFLPHAFDRFTRADLARGAGDGTGLGLAIVAALVSAYGGTVTARNRAAGGASVRVHLPAAGTPRPAAVVSGPGGGTHVGRFP